MKRLTACLLGVALAGLTAACGGAANDNYANANHSNINHANVNANANAANANTAAATNRNYNAKITKEEYEKEKERYGREAKEAGETIGQGLTDGWLWVKTKGALALVDDLKDSTINVDVDNSVVTLRGSVDNAAQKSKAETTAKGIDGVKSVKNQLTVGPATGAANANNANKAAANANAHK